MLPMVRGGQVRETWWNYSLTAIRGADHSVGGIFNQGNEITEVVKARRERQAEVERWRALFQQAPAPVALLGGPAHVFEFANEAYLSRNTPYELRLVNHSNSTYFGWSQAQNDSYAGGAPAMDPLYGDPDADFLFRTGMQSVFTPLAAAPTAGDYVYFESAPLNAVAGSGSTAVSSSKTPANSSSVCGAGLAAFRVEKKRSTCASFMPRLSAAFSPVSRGRGPGPPRWRRACGPAARGR